MRTWLERHFAEDFYSPPDFKLLHKIIAVAEGVRDESGGDGDCEFLGYVRSKLSAAEVMNTQEEAIESKLQGVALAMKAYSVPGIKKISEKPKCPSSSKSTTEA